MQRRAFLGTLAVLAAPRAAEAQQPGKIPVVGVLNFGVGPRSATVDITRRGRRDLGYFEGQTVAFDVRFAGMKLENLPGLAADLVRKKVDVLLVIGPAAIRAAGDATSTIPIVVLDLESDPVHAGFARSFAQPGGSITGCFLDQASLTGKWLELIGEAAPGTRSMTVLRDTTTGPWQLAAIKGAAERLRIELQVLETRNSGDLDHVLGAGIPGGSRALIDP